MGQGYNPITTPEQVAQYVKEVAVLCQSDNEAPRGRHLTPDDTDFVNYLDTTIN